MKALRIIVVSVGLLGAWASSGICASLTLARCINEALRLSPQLSASHHDIEAAHSEITKQRGTTLPHLSGKLEAWEVNGEAVTPLAALNLFQPEPPTAGSRRRIVGAHWGPVADQEVAVT